MSVRLDTETRERLAEFMSQNHMSTSQAVRVLLTTSLRENQTLDQAFKRAAFREGVVLGVAKVKEGLARHVDEILEDMNG